MHSFTFEAIGTHWVIDIEDSLSEVHFISLKEHIRQRIAVFDATYSRFREDSFIRIIASHVGKFSFAPEGVKMLRLYKQLYDLTDGQMTPLIGSVLEDAGYDSSYSLKAKPLISPPSWEEALTLEGSKLTTKAPVLLDLGALGKGMLIDIIGELLAKDGCSTYCIDAGGDILTKNSPDKPMRIGLEHPGVEKQVIGVVTLNNKSIASSAGNRRKWGNFHHIMHPQTLRPVDGTLATWVIADTAVVADALATALFFTKPSTLQPYFDFEYLIIYPDYTINKSDAFPAELYYTETKI